MIILWLIATILILLFGLTVFRGAPYVPTHRRQVEKVLDMLDLEKGDVVVDLGSGDGVFLKAAAKRGLVAYGYEINPLLCLVAWVRCAPYRDRVHIRLRDFWFSSLPPNTKAVFVFAGGPFMSKLARKLEVEADKHAPFYVASYGFELPGWHVIEQQEGINLYRIE